MLSKKQFEILEVLVSKGPLSQRELARETTQSVGNVNRPVKELANEHFIRDGAITAEGIAALEPYRVKRAVFLAASFGSRLIPITLIRRNLWSG